jgi:hypothetical protein
VWTKRVVFLERSTVVYGGRIDVGAAGIAVWTGRIAVWARRTAVRGLNV